MIQQSQEQARITALRDSLLSLWDLHLLAFNPRFGSDDASKQFSKEDEQIEALTRDLWDATQDLRPGGSEFTSFSVLVKPDLVATFDRGNITFWPCFVAINLTEA